MSLAQRFERRLEGMVGTAFARVFKGQVEPVEIASALQREAIDKKAVMGSGQVLVPNRYRVTLGGSDYERLSPWEAQLAGSLAEMVQETIDDHRVQTIGDIEVYLALDEQLHTGVFGVASRMEPDAPPRRRPHESMSMPVIDGLPGAYVHDYADRQADDQRADQRADQQPPAQEYGNPPAVPRPPSHPPEPVRPPPIASSPSSERYERHELRAHLVVDGSTATLHLKAGSNIIGRGSEADLQLLDQGVSRRHVDVHVSNGQATAYDLNSTNGTSVNGHAVSHQPLQHGDVVRVGHTRLVYQEDSG